MMTAASVWAARAGRLLFPLIDSLVPKDPRVVLFQETNYTDNSRTLFQHLCADAFFQPVWLTTDPRQEREIAADVGPGRTAKKRSWQGFRLALRARTLAFSAHPIHLWPFRKRPGRRLVVMLWHAVEYKQTPLLHTRNPPRRYKDLGPRLLEYSPLISMMIASSGLDQVAKAASHGVDGRKVIVTGLPRTDKLIGVAAPPANLPQEIETALTGRTILYAPTWREGAEPTRFFPFEDFDPAALDAALKRLDAYLVMRPHRLDHDNRKRAEEWTRAGIERLVLGTSDVVPDAADILPFVDLLVTDYSSIYLDFLLLDRPMIFIPYDLDSYLEGRGLMYDYQAVTPGPKISTQAELIDQIERSLLEGAPQYASHRAVLKGLFHAYDDGKSTERVTEHLRAMLRV